MIPLNYVTDYLRLASYSMVILTTIFSLRCVNHTKLLAIGNIIFAFVLFTGRIFINFYQVYNVDYNTFVMTPAAIVWAVLHFERFLKISK